MHPAISERVNARAMSSAAVLQACDVLEQAAARGRFHWQLHRPAPHHIDGFIMCRDEISALERLPLALRAPQVEHITLRKRQLAQFKQELEWEDRNHNMVFTAGGNDLLDKYFAGSSYTAAWFLGLVSNTSFTAFALADTSASHAGWVEDQNYSQATRVSMAFASASAKSKALTAPLTFSMNASTTLVGSFPATVSTKGGSTGIFYSGGAFTGGNQPVINGNTLSASWTGSC